MLFAVFAFARHRDHLKKKRAQRLSK